MPKQPSPFAQRPGGRKKLWQMSLAAAIRENVAYHRSDSQQTVNDASYVWATQVLNAASAGEPVPAKRIATAQNVLARQEGATRNPIGEGELVKLTALDTLATVKERIGGGLLESASYRVEYETPAGRVKTAVVPERAIKRLNPFGFSLPWGRRKQPWQMSVSEYLAEMNPELLLSDLALSSEWVRAVVSAAENGAPVPKGRLIEAREVLAEDFEAEQSRRKNPDVPSVTLELIGERPRRAKVVHLPCEECGQQIPVRPRDPIAECQECGALYQVNR